ncbi:13457_t:CDS:2 [Cetraspora pellucida]|uniref:13457_t:CDS:1 n=1 Tax=Cetraspora pellucida TaxID=1433469 RepID=A0A9N9B128_9GLOM|nr:13457_t:CDS:2 [Cetraspora pellucida]
MYNDQTFDNEFVNWNSPYNEFKETYSPDNRYNNLDDNEIFDKISAMITDNASSMEMAFQQLDITHLGCTAYTIYLVVTNVQQEVMQELCKKIKFSQQKSGIPIINQVLMTDMASFFDDGVEPSSFSSVDIKLQTYSISEIPKYNSKNLLYEKHNPLKWWNKHKSTLHLLAEQA